MSRTGFIATLLGTNRPRSVRRERAAVAFVVAVLGVAASLTLPVPYLVLDPGSVVNTLGEQDGKAVIAVTGVPTYPTTGQVDLVTVRESGQPFGPLTMIWAVRGFLSKSAAVVPHELIYPPQESGQDSLDRNAADWNSAQTKAASAAALQGGLPVGQRPVIVTVSADGPAAGILAHGDIIETVGGVPVSTSTQAVDALRATAPGTVTTIGILRGAEQLTEQVTLGANPKDPSLGYLGVTIQPDLSVPFDVEVSLDGIGGPSAGLSFSLAVLDEITPGDLTQGKHVAATGTISADGVVGPIGGIRQKVAAVEQAGGDVFLIPKDNCAEVAGYVPAGLPVAPVASLAEATTVIGDFAAGRTLPTCPAS